MKRRNLEDEMDLTQESVRDLAGWCIQIALHQCFGVGRQRLIRLNRLYAEARANYEQMNEEGKSAGIDVAMEHLRRCACAAMQTEDIVVEEGQDDQWLQVQRQRMQEQEKTFAKRVILQEVGRRRQSRTPGAALLGDAALRQKFEAAREETFRGTMALRRK